MPVSAEEVRGPRAGNVQNHDHGLQVSVEGKQGGRTVMLIPSILHVHRWLDAHPDRDDPDAPLSSKIHQCEEISDRMASKTLEDAAERAGVDKTSRSEFLDVQCSPPHLEEPAPAHIEDHHGWVRGSKIVAQ